MKTTEEKSLRGQLHTLIGNRARAEKKDYMRPGIPHFEKALTDAKEEVEKFLKEHPELMDEVAIFEDYFLKKFYGWL